MGKIMHGNQVYSGGGGSVVEANPSDTAGTNLTKIKIDGSTYAIPQGGGGGAVDDVQIDNVSVVDQNGIAHIDTMTGAGSSSAGTGGLVPAPASGDNEKFLAGDGTWKSVPGGGASAVSDLTDVDLDNLSDGQVLKWNADTEKWENADESGGGGGGSKYEIETLTWTGNGATTKSWTFDKKPIMILSMDGMGSGNYVNIPPFRYGSPQAQGFYGGGSAATGTNGGVLHCPISYSADMLTMTMRGVDAGAICNLSGKTNTMYYLVES